MIYPKHVALIPDGNRTRAKEKGIAQILGHMEGTKRVVDHCKYIFTQTPIKVFTTWGLSTENLKERSEEELEYLFELYKTFNKELEEFAMANKVNFRRVGNRQGLPQHLLDYLDEQERILTFDYDRYIVIALNYGGRDELVRGINKFINANPSKSITQDDINGSLDFSALPPLELVIRTKGDQATRLSGFMLWWVGYAELYFSAKKNPEFDTQELQKALEWFDSMAQKRNYGK